MIDGLFAGTKSVIAVATIASALNAAAQTIPNTTLTAIRGVTVGHATMPGRPTGCTAILVASGAVAAVAQRGAAPATRDTALLRIGSPIDRVDGISLAGGSAFGLDAASGVVHWIDEHVVGDRRSLPPIVPGAALIDLWVGGKPQIRPDADCGYRAAGAASSRPVEEGSVGAGAGATVGKMRGRDGAMKAGIGSTVIELPDGLQVGAIVAVNALGDVIDPRSGRVVAGIRNADGSLADARKLLRSGEGSMPARAGENTTIGVIVTNARLTKTEAARVATMADDGYARAIVPIHTTADGDTVFALATGTWDGAVDVTRIGALAADAMSDAIVRAATQATGAAGIPAVRDLRK